MSIKPWDNEPAPLANHSAVEEYSPRLKLYVDLEAARNLERRMRKAERLLHRSSKYIPSNALEYTDLIDHLDAARMEDEHELCKENKL